MDGGRAQPPKTLLAENPMLARSNRVRLELMNLSVPGHPYALERQLAELEQVREVLITTVLEARAACETGSDGPRAQLLLSAAVKDVEDLDDQLHTLRSAASISLAQPAGARR